MLEFVRRRFKAFACRQRQKAVLSKEGFLVFCRECGEWLNDGRPCAEMRGGLHEYRCSCGKSTRFDMDAPVPLLVPIRTD
jgi:hypothetical protein